MRVFITGGSGFIGMNVIEKFLEAGEEIFNYDVTDILPCAGRHFKDLPGSYHYVKGDILDREKLMSSLAESKADTVIHMAVITVTEDRERRNARYIFDVNCGGTLNILDASVACKIKRFLYISSIAAYGDKAFQGEVLEEDMLDVNPDNLYQITKYTSEHLVLRYQKLYDMEIACARLGDVFGPWERPTEFRDKMSAPCITLKYAMEKVQAVLKRPNRTSWVYSRDVGAGIYTLSRAPLKYGIYNISSCYIWSIEEWCQSLTEYFPGFQWIIEDGSARVNVFYHGKHDNAPMSVDRLTDAGYRPVFDMETALKDYVKWAEKYSDMFREVK